VTAVQYLKAENLAQALAQAAAAAGERMKFLAGGTDLCVQIAEGALDPTLLIDISAAEELRRIEHGAEGLRIGAALPIAELLEAARAAAAGKRTGSAGIPRCLLQGAAAIGSPQIRQLGTIGGNVCNASPCGDTLAPLIVLAAGFTLSSARGRRVVPAEEFFLGPKATVLEPGEILESILIPASHLSGRSAFRMIGKRNGQAISQVNVAVWLKLEQSGGSASGGGSAAGGAPGAAAGTPAAGNSIEDIRIAAGSVAPIPLRLGRAEERLRGSVPDEAALQAAAKAVQEEIRPISDVRTSQAYRRGVAASLFMDVMAEVLEREGG
jgi:carbon-monoxide dehydrogenase medium subunit